eukprot:GILK01006897.1.p1 GENE.GILK01006897.1~~GILK01006897.1.p1  ORF type:complete len:993 (-),score=218.03 GILK01006897.1:158-3094(-)
MQVRQVLHQNVSQNILDSLENVLREKIHGKANSKCTDESFLVKAFRFYDLANSGTCTMREFKSTLEKMGLVADNHQYEALFFRYDSDGDGQIHYKDFAEVLFRIAPKSVSHVGPATVATVQSQQYKYVGMSSAVGSPMNRKDTTQLRGRHIETILGHLRHTLALKGARGILALIQSFKSADTDDRHYVSIAEFRRILRELNLGLAEPDTLDLFRYFDQQREGKLYYQDFLLELKGSLDSIRQAIVDKAFAKIDRFQSGTVSLADLTAAYDAKTHPDVRSGRKTADQAMDEFMDTLEMFLQAKNGFDSSQEVSYEDFVDYYSYLSCLIDDEQYFICMMTRAWKLTETVSNEQQQQLGRSDRNGSLSSDIGQHRVNPRDPFSPASARRKESILSSDRMSSRRSVSDSGNGSSQISKGAVSFVLKRLREKLSLQGAKGFISLLRTFQSVDMDQIGLVSLKEFVDVLRENGLSLSEQETDLLIRYFDHDGVGTITYDEFITDLKGELNHVRRELIKTAFAKLDVENTGYLSVDDLKKHFDSRNVSDVRAGRKSHEQAVQDFIHHLSTFLITRNPNRYDDDPISEQEFEEFYTTLGSSIDDDEYFKSMIETQWKPPHRPVKISGFGALSPTRANSLIGSTSNQSPRHDLARLRLDSVSSVGSGRSSPSLIRTPGSPMNHIHQGKDIAGRVNQHDPKPAWGPSSSPFATDLVQPIDSAPRRKIWQPQYKSQVRFGDEYTDVKGRPTLQDVENVVRKMKIDIQSRGIRGLSTLSRQLRQQDRQNRGSIRREEFGKILKLFSRNLSVPDIDTLFGYFDYDREGSANYLDFLDALVGPLSEQRRQVVLETFEKLDQHGTGGVYLDQIRNSFNERNHPDVRIGRRQPDEVRMEFLDTFELRNVRSQEVTVDDFERYYEMVSACVEDDEHFALLLRNCWTAQTNATAQRGSQRFSETGNSVGNGVGERMSPSRSLQFHSPSSSSSNFRR